MSKMDDLLASLSDDDRELLLEYLDAGTSAERLSEALTSCGYPIGKTVINEWRAERRGDD